MPLVKELEAGIGFIRASIQVIRSYNWIWWTGIWNGNCQLQACVLFDILQKCHFLSSWMRCYWHLPSEKKEIGLCCAIGLTRLLLILHSGRYAPPREPHQSQRPLPLSVSSPPPISAHWFPPLSKFLWIILSCAIDSEKSNARFTDDKLQLCSGLLHGLSDFV